MSISELESGENGEEDRNELQPTSLPSNNIKSSLGKRPRVFDDDNLSRCSKSTAESTLRLPEHRGKLFLSFDPYKEGNIFCEICKSSFKGWESHLAKHLSTDTHQDKEKTTKTNQNLVSIMGFITPRKSTESILHPVEAFQENSVKHLIACGLSLLSVNKIFTPAFLEGLKLWGPRLTTGQNLLQNILPKVVVHAQEEIKRLTTNVPFSILVDETPDVNGRALLAVMLSTASFIVVLKITILDGGATFNGERLATHVSQVMQD